MWSDVFCTFLLLFSVVTELSTHEDEEDEYEYETVAISLTRPDKPFAYIDTTCKNDTACRDFKCSAFSRFAPNLQWFFKACIDETCSYEPMETPCEVNGLQSTTSVKIDIVKSGYLKCLVDNSEGSVEVIQEVVPVNNTRQRFIELTEVKYVYNILPETKEIDVHWSITVEGRPSPEIFLMANNETILETSPKYVCKTSLTDVVLKITNASSEDLDTRFILFATNEYQNKTLNLTFKADDAPNTHIEVVSLNRTYCVIKCVADSIFTTNIYWFFKPCIEGNCTYQSMESLGFNRTTLRTVSYFGLNSSLPGFLKCSANNSVDSTEVTQEVDDVRDGLDIFGMDNIEDIDAKTKRIEIEPSKSIILTCGASLHNHSANITWAWPNIDTELDRSTALYSYTIFSIRQTIEISPFLDYSKPQIFGSYFCKSWLENGTLDYKQIEVTSNGLHEWTYYALAIMLVIVFCVVAFIIVKMRKFQKLQKEMDELNTVGLANFEKGALDHWNPNLTLDDQADLLPYDKSYEFPIEKLKLGEQIGSGAFGVVVKAEAKGVYQDEAKTTVAVKMVNRNIGDIYIKALASELKVMIHLGKHVNVVNLLGACTQNVSKRELLVIVEYCRFGNLQTYLLSHRHTFIDQINAETGQIDFTIGSDILGASDPEFPYITPSFSNRSYQELPNSTTVPSKSGKEEVVLKAENDQKLHYQGDYKHINKPVCTRDLLVWSFQVARGMEYLSSRKVLHGDLAARNILLTDGNVAKICDFGLSKKMYQKDIYKKAGDEMLPVKWMAIESITDKIFSIQSDVWSFGIVLWEMFSLARTPYPGMEYNESFCEKLLDGYRMKSPQFATQEIYQIMLHCWDAEPMIRPSFTELARKIGYIMEKPIRDHYIDMNSGYLKMNAQRFNKDNNDYLSMVSAPTFKQFSSPYRYVNVVKPDDEDVSTYL